MGFSEFNLQIHWRSFIIALLNHFKEVYQLAMFPKNLLNRNLILHLNKYQQRILFPVLLSCLIACACAFFSLLTIYYPDDFALYKNFRVYHLKQKFPLFLVGASSFLLVLLFWTYYMSNKLVGPYERILKELDAILQGKQKGPIGIRKGDEMFAELLKRINSLLK